MSDEKINQEMKDVVIIRIESMPSNLKLSIGNHQSLTKEEMIKHVMDEDDTGRQIINSHISFMKAIARGDFTKAMTSI